MTTTAADKGHGGWLTGADCRLDEFRAVVEETTRIEDYPTADSVERGVLVYGGQVTDALDSPDQRYNVQAELARALMTGPGVVVFKHALDPEVVDRATAVFEALIREQRSGGAAVGDHFAQPGANDRVWGALDKLAARDPRVFADYYANDLIALIAESWLGPGYQITSQVNVVNPGGRAQVAHRDYHLGFMSSEQAQRWPTHVHRLSPALTLQGAVAHCDMPLETGPTLYLPHSQKYEPGYLAFHQPQFTQYFDQHCVQLPLEKGDAAFFNPAVFHAAGTNRSAHVRRMANLLQISSAFGRAMETVSRTALCEAVFPALLERKDAGRSDVELRNIVAACAEGYAFPTNLDRDQPIGGLAPPTQADLLWQAVAESWDAARLSAELAAQESRRSVGVT
jgi:ectoine hydroxylase-related dioxygenase (phytanoyl-CoA dioxygenase family)